SAGRTSPNHERSHHDLDPRRAGRDGRGSPAAPCAAVGVRRGRRREQPRVLDVLGVPAAVLHRRRWHLRGRGRDALPARAHLRRVRGHLRGARRGPHDDPVGQVPPVLPVRRGPRARAERRGVLGPLGPGGTATLVYAYVTYAALGLAYSLVNIPYGSLASAMTQRPDERAKLASYRMIGTASTIIMLAFVVAPQIEGSKGDPAQFQRSLTLTTLAFLVVGVGLYWFLFKTARETVYREVDHVSMRQS